jgi:hypothetical protein
MIEIKVRRAPAGRSVKVAGGVNRDCTRFPPFYIDRGRKRDSEASLTAEEGGSHTGNNELVDSGIQPGRAHFGTGFAVSEFFYANLCCRAGRTRAGVRGYSRSRTPVASNNALAMAAAAGPITSSPPPLDV